MIVRTQLFTESTNSLQCNVYVFYDTRNLYNLAILKLIFQQNYIFLVKFPLNL